MAEEGIVLAVVLSLDPGRGVPGIGQAPLIERAVEVISRARAACVIAGVPTTAGNSDVPGRMMRKLNLRRRYCSGRRLRSSSFGSGFGARVCSFIFAFLHLIWVRGCTHIEAFDEPRVVLVDIPRQYSHIAGVDLYPGGDAEVASLRDNIVSGRSRSHRVSPENRRPIPTGGIDAIAACIG